MQSPHKVTNLLLSDNRIKVLCEQTHEVNKRIRLFFGLSLILSGLGNIVADFRVKSMSSGSVFTHNVPKKKSNSWIRRHYN